MRIYIATKLENHIAADLFAQELRNEGARVTSSWHAHDTPRPNEAELSGGQLQTIANENFIDLDLADALVLLPFKGLRGSLIEFGYAIGRKMPVVVRGNAGDLSLMARHRDVVFVPEYATAASVWEVIHARLV